MREDSESESSEDFTNSETPKNQPNDYEKQRDLRVSQNKTKLQALGLQSMANSLFSLGPNKEKGKVKTTQLRRSKRVSRNSKFVDDDDEYNPHDDDDGNDDDDDDDDEDNGHKKKKGGGFSRSNSKKMKNRLRSNSHKSLQKSADIPDLMDEDEALKQAIALSLNEFGETPDQQHARSNQCSQEDNSRKKKPFKNHVQMNEDDVVINFCQFDEAGKGSITLRDLQQMAVSHDFPWTEKELVDMIRCFDSDNDGKLTVDDFRSIILRCNMFQAPE